VNVLDRLIAWMAPQWGANRARARLAVRHFEAASVGRRTDGWHRLGTDANAAAAGALGLLRAQARDLVRNNPWARKGLRRIVTGTVGWGIKPKATGRGAELVQQRWREWAETTQCDAAGRLTMYGLQALVMRAVARDGECLIRRRWRLPTDGLAVPLQLQVLEPDFLDAARDGMMGEAGGPIVQGVEFDAIGRRAAYWLFDRHPGSTGAFGTGAKNIGFSRRIPAAEILHVFELERPGQVRGTSWFASVDVRLHELDGFEDATVVKQRIAASMAAFVTDLGDGGGPIAQGGIDSATSQPTDIIEPGAIISLPIGKQVTVTNPPQASDYQSFTACSLRAIAAGIGVTYEGLTGDYSQTNYSSGRLGQLGAQADIHDWRWNVLIPQFCAPAWDWMLQAMILAGADVENAPAKWAPPPAQLLDPDKEGKANAQLVRSGQMTWPQMVREQGEDPDEQLDEIEAFNKDLDRRGIALDCDPRRMTAAGGAQQVWSAGSIVQWPPPPAPAALPAAGAGKPAAGPPGAKADGADAPAGDSTDASGDPAAA
jgi:lambda family phage portal protein